MTKVMTLSQLLNQSVDTDRDITGITADSRQVKEGNLFVALPGLNFNGADFIEAAIGAGAVAVLCAPDAHEKYEASFPDIIWVVDAKPAQVFPKIVARYFDKQPRHVAAVTGTNGKTSVASFTRQIWEHMNYKAGTIGTLGVQANGYDMYTGMTTPDPVVLHRAISDLCDMGVDHVVFEASSHGLAQHRLDGMSVMAAAFTNLTRDHFDYHGSEENYLYAKARLFGEVMKPGNTAVLNADSPVISQIADICWARGHHVITVGKHNGDIRLLKQQPSPAGQEITVSYKAEIYDITLPLVGDFQASNALMAVGLVIGCGGDAKAAFEALSYLRPVPGRMEQAARHPSGARVYVDYAHTPDALETVLTSLKGHVRNKLSVVFGCGGDRDAGKRPIMGEIAARIADRVYVTDDNPRTEDAATIRSEIMAACPDAQEIDGRADAIMQAVADLQEGDLLLVAGKGHEQGQIIGTETIDFDDISEIRTAVSRVSDTGQNSRRNAQ